MPSTSPEARAVKVHALPRASASADGKTRLLEVDADLASGNMVVHWIEAGRRNLQEIRGSIQ